VGKKLLARLAVTFGVSIAMLGGFVSTASAAPAAVETTMTAMAPVTAAVTCSTTGCDHKDPVDSGCSASAVLVTSKNTSKGLFRLYYSTACGTNWIQVNNYAGGSTRPDGYLHLVVWDVARGVWGFDFFDAQPTRGLHYGNMIYSPGNRCTAAWADWDADGSSDVLLRSSGC